MRKSAFLIAILLTMATLLTACGKDPDILCGNCAATVPGDSFFCPNCGTAFFQNGTENSTGETTIETTNGTVNTEGSTATPENKPVQPDNTPEQTPTETVHVHNYSAATCLAPQTCACGATNGGLAEHTYRNYICAYCYTVDKGHAYDYLCAWIQNFGTWQNDMYRIDIKDGDMMYSLAYDGCAYVSVSFDSDGEFCFSGLWLDDYSCGTTLGNLKIQGYVNPYSFTASSPISVTSCNGNESEKQELAELAQAAVCEMLSWLDAYLYYNDAGITIEDLGFTAY